MTCLEIIICFQETGNLDKQRDWYQLPAEKILLTVSWVKHRRRGKFSRQVSLFLQQLIWLQSPSFLNPSDHHWSSWVLRRWNRRLKDSRFLLWVVVMSERKWDHCSGLEIRKSQAKLIAVSWDCGHPQKLTSWPNHVFWARGRHPFAKVFYKLQQCEFIMDYKWLNLEKEEKEIPWWTVLHKQIYA